MVIIKNGLNSKFVYERGGFSREAVHRQEYLNGEVNEVLYKDGVDGEVACGEVLYEQDGHEVRWP